MRIVADENIPLVEQAFAGLGQVEVRPGRDLRREHLAGADILLVRSVTRVDRELLEGTPVRFVGTATIGTDHVDTEYLARQGITFAAAAGCNAYSVAEYVVTALLELRDGGRLSPTRPPTVGIVGLGHVGGRLAAKLEALGWPVLINDPPRQRRGDPGEWHSLDETLAAAHVVTLHVPLTRSGQDATLHLLGPTRLRQLRDDALLINTARGSVVDGAALRAWLEADSRRGAVLDVWEKEPRIDPALARRVWIGTPHIAGYSQDGKLTGTRMMHDAVARFLGLAPAWIPPVPPEVAREVVLGPPQAEQAPEEVARELVRSRYAIARDDAALRAVLAVQTEPAGQGFDRLRREYPPRWEWRHTRVRCIGFPNDHPLPRLLAGLGFTVVAPDA